MSNSPAASSHWLVRLAIVAVLLVAIVLGVSYVLRPVAQVMPAIRNKAVHTVPGAIGVKAEVHELKSEVNGRVSASVLDLGKRVAKGDVLVQLDTGDVDLEIEKIKNDIVAARRKVEIGSTLRPEVLNMKDTLENLERQTKLGAYPVGELEKQRRLLQQLEQRMNLEDVNNKLVLENGENALRTKLREKEKMTITAPTDGVVTVVNARVGDLIANNSIFATVISVGLTVEAKISEENYASVQLGQRAVVRFLTYGDEKFEATVIKKLPTADAGTQRYIVYLDLKIAPERLLPDLTGEVSIVVGERESQAIIPRRAVFDGMVFVVQQGRVERRKVRLGYTGLNDAEVLEGLQTGEQVIVEKLDQFQEGDRVSVEVVK
jgi:RND family efflux transporter MFP subunit